MKKLLSKLFIFALGATALTGCDLFSFETGEPKGDEEHEVKGLVLRDYTNTATQDTHYVFDGKVFLSYVDESVPEYEVTAGCTYSTLDTSTVGDKVFTVKYDGSKYTYSKSVYIQVKEKVTLQSIKVEDGYVSTMKKGDTYAFIGTVTATYSDGSTENVTSKVKIDTSYINNNFAGTYNVNLSYTKDGKTADTTIQVTVIDLISIEVKNYTSLVKKGATYEFNGVVYAKYSDGLETNISGLVVVDTSEVDVDTVGKYNVNVSFTDCNTILSTKVEVTVYVDLPKLSNIVASDYTNEIEKGDSYTFDGTVTANYEDGSQEVVTNRCNYGTISSVSPGEKKLSISFTTKYTVDGKEFTNTKTTNAVVNVISTLKSISGSDLSLGVGRTKKINLSYSPSDATNRNVTYESSDPSIATVNPNGDVTGVSKGDTTITITSELSSSINTTINVKVDDIQNAAWTILVYMCGADLESKYADTEYHGCASLDLQEIASVSGQPSDVNVVVQAGGATKWDSMYSSVVKAGKRNRFHLNNKNYVLDSQDEAVNMGLGSTLQDFISWGIEKYPADNIGLIFWNHGGAITGCCADEEFSNNILAPEEMVSGIRGAREYLGLTQKFEFIGYDCCLMQFHDLAGLNSEFAKYQVGSEESEWGYGWTYDGWIDNLFSKDSTTEILTEIVDSFGEYTDYAYHDVWKEQNDQTLSFVDLSYWETYKNAWENMASSLSSIITSNSKWNTLATLLSSCTKYGDTYDLFDVGDFLNKMEDESSPYKDDSTLMSRIDDIQAVYSDFVAHEFHGDGAGNSSGLALYAPVSYSLTPAYYTESVTPFRTWRTLCENYGNWWSWH